MYGMDHRVQLGETTSGLASAYQLTNSSSSVGASVPLDTSATEEAFEEVSKDPVEEIDVQEMEIEQPEEGQQ